MSEVEQMLELEVAYQWYKNQLKINEIELKLSRNEVLGLYFFCLSYLRFNEEYLNRNIDKADRIIRITNQVEGKKTTAMNNPKQKNFTLRFSFADALYLWNAHLHESNGLIIGTETAFEIRSVMYKMDHELKCSNLFRTHYQSTRSVPMLDKTPTIEIKNP